MAAATQTVPALLTLDEYLRTSYHPDCDFVDGQLEERNMGETKHGLLQVEIAFWFRSHQPEWKIRVITELRTRVARTRVRIPDITVAMDDDAIREQVRVTPPLIAIEILSPEDNLRRVKKRLQDFLEMGIENVWLVDPIKRIGSVYTNSGLEQVNDPNIHVPDSAIYLDLHAVFSALD